jgi:hypothetical protein
VTNFRVCQLSVPHVLTHERHSFKEEEEEEEEEEKTDLVVPRVV